VCLIKAIGVGAADEAGSNALAALLGALNDGVGGWGVVFKTPKFKNLFLKAPLPFRDTDAKQLTLLNLLHAHNSLQRVQRTLGK
jgi:hypothetical protein